MADALPSVGRTTRSWRFVFACLPLLLVACASGPPTTWPGENPGDMVGHRPLDAGAAADGTASAPGAGDLVLHALAFLDSRYRYGGQSPETGFDCSGFVRHVVEQARGLTLPRRAEDQARATQPIRRADLRPGDLVFFNTLRRPYSHVGIYVGEDRFIHAPRTGAQVRVEHMGVAYWSGRFNGARRVADDSAVAMR